MSEEEIYKMLLNENVEKFPLLNEIFAIRNNKFKINNYTIYVTGCISLDVINRAIEKVNLIDKLQKENEILKNTNKNLSIENQSLYESINCDDDTSLSHRYMELKEENASLKKEINLMKSVNINENYISKDKIRNKIKELEKSENPSIADIYESMKDFAIEVLEELLGDDINEN